MKSFLVRGRNRKGNALIQVIIAAGLTSVLALVMASMLTDQTKQIRSLEEKLSLQESNALLASLMKDPIFCSCYFRQKNLNTTTGTFNEPLTTVPLSYTTVPSFPTACTPSPAFVIPAVNGKFQGHQMSTQSISMIDIAEVTPGSGNYYGNFRVQIKDTVRAMKDVLLPVTFSVDLALGSPVARPFRSCDLNLPPPPGAPTRVDGGPWWSPDMNFQTVACPAGRNVISGGVRCRAGAGQVFVMDSYPSSATTWTAGCDNEVNAGLTMWIWALCQ